MEESKYTYKKDYYETHKENYYRAMRKYLDKNKRHIIYMLQDNDLNPLYIGSTDNKFRINYHLSGYGTLELTEEKWNELNCKCFVYAYVDSVYDKKERLYIENYLYEKYKESGKLLNINKPLQNDSCIDEMRKYELEEIAEKLDFKIFY